MKVVACDSRQIEARIVAWLAGHTLLMELFGDSKRDVYGEMGSQFFGREITKEKTPDERQSSKSMCWAGETPVLTQRGWVPIRDVLGGDQVWDGVEWVSHAGVAAQGVREVWESRSVAATPDHEILTERGWREWRGVLTSRSLFQSAIVSGNSLSLSGGSGAQSAPGGQWAGIRQCGATAAGSGLLLGITSRPGAVRGATNVRKLPPVRSAGGNTRTRWTTTRTGADFLPGLTPRFPGVTTPVAGSTRATAVEGSLFTVRGAEIVPGFFVTFKPFPIGTSLPLKWTGLTMITGIAPETSGLSHAPRTCSTAERSRSFRSAFAGLKYETETYDLLSCGPRSRFTILSDAGPLVVHNCLGCGYGMGWYKFAGEMLKGMFGAPPRQFTQVDVETLGVDVEQFMRSENKMERVAKMPSRLPMAERVIHCAVAENLIWMYRDASQPVVELWDTMEEVIGAMYEGREETFGPGDFLQTTKNGVILPNDMVLRYPGLRSVEGEYSYLGGRGGKERVKCYGGSMTENICQAVARVVISDQMLMIYGKYGLRPVTCTHDELVYIVPDDAAEDAFRKVKAEMCAAPEWATGLPLDASGGIGSSYGDAK